MCYFFGFMMIFAGCATMSMVCTMSIERVLSIKYPYMYYAKLKRKHGTWLVLGCWTLAGFMASLPLMGFGEIVLQYPKTWCFIDYYTSTPVHKAFNCIYAGITLIMIIVTVTCNITVIYTLVRNQSKQGFLKSKSKGESRKYSGYRKRFVEVQMLVLLIGITLVFSTCYGPLMVSIWHSYITTHVYPYASYPMSHYT
jgi:prostaglandin E receptor 4